MTIDQALVSADPIGEISCRLALAKSLTNAERVFHEVSYFLGDTLNGGLNQTFANDTGDLFNTVRDFAQNYCDVAVARVLDRIPEVFPAGLVPTDRNQRMDFLAAASIRDSDPFEELTVAFYEVQDELEAGLLAFAVQHRDQFSNLHGPR